jgi:hypothetical protein
MQAILLTLAVLAATGVAQQPQAAGGPSDEQKRIRVEGRVTSAAGEPLSKATVRLMPGNLVIMGGGGRGGAAPVIPEV